MHAQPFLVCVLQSLNEIPAAPMDQAALAAVMAVKCMPGSVRRGHGLKVVLTLTSSADQRALSDMALDLCGDVYGAMPPGTAAAANWVLPLKVYGEFSQTGDGTGILYSFVVGARKLSHGTLRQRLAALKNAGDPAFALALSCTFKAQPRLFCCAATRASDILTALDSDSHHLQMTEPVPTALLAQAKARLHPSALRVGLLVLRWWLLALLFTALCYGLLIAPTEVAQAASRVLPRPIRLHGPAASRRVQSALPPVPETLSQAFQLGDLSARYFAGRDPELLAQAAALLSRDRPLSEQEIGGVLAHLRELEQRVGLVTRVRGFFTFINTLWLMAILGIAVSIGPSLMVLLRPLREWLRRCAKWAFQNIVQPLVRRLHDWGVLEGGAWALCGGLVVQAQQHAAEEVALYIASTGLALAGPALAYSTFCHGGKLQGGSPSALHRMVSTWTAFTAAALAMAHGSTFLGYVAVVALYAAIGFHVVAYGLCLAIGFEDDSAMEACAVTSFMLLTGVGALRFLNTSFGWAASLEPFRSAVSVFGSVILFLALLIMSSRFYRRARYGHRSYYGFVNVLTLVLLLGFMAVGLVGGLAGMANTATVFLVLWLVEKYADFHVELDWNVWVLVLVLSVAAWRGALWLHSRPQFVASLFDF